MREFNWFFRLLGFQEPHSADDLHEMVEIEGTRLRSKVTGESFGCGRLEVPTLAELRARVDLSEDHGPNTLSEEIGNAQAIHARPENAGALLQAASQFNLLEMTSYNVSPEAGITGYEYDATQGPACAIACGAGTVIRNYFAEVGGGQIGQTADNQVDCLRGVGEALGEGFWRMQNGYALLNAGKLSKLNQRLLKMGEEGRDELRSKLQIGVQWDVEVTLNRGPENSTPGHHVTQVYGSALALGGYGGVGRGAAAFATLVLEASYEATLLAAVENARLTGNRTVFLTLLGGGVFGNEIPWILSAIDRALKKVPNQGLDVRIVSFSRSKPLVRKLVEAWR